MNVGVGAGRDAGIDAARGIAIAMVVLGHALIGVGAAVGDTRFSRFLLMAVYSSHMPLFFILSGFLAGRRQAAIGATLTHLMGRIVWPYVLWSSILLLSHHTMSAHTNSAVSQLNLWSVLWKPPAVMWFLYVLFLGHIARVLTAGLPKRALACLGVFAVVYPYTLEPEFLNLRFVGVFLLANLLSRDIWAELRRARGVFAASLVTLASLGVMWLQSDGTGEGYPAGTWIFLPMLVAGPVLIFAAGNDLARTPIGGFLQLIGRHSMAIFVMHILLTAGVRIALVNFGNEAFWPLVLASALAGILLPLILSIQAKRLGFARLLGW